MEITVKVNANKIKEMISTEVKNVDLEYATYDQDRCSRIFNAFKGIYGFEPSDTDEIEEEICNSSFGIGAEYSGCYVWFKDGKMYVF